MSCEPVRQQVRAWRTVRGKEGWELCQQTGIRPGGFQLNHAKVFGFHRRGCVAATQGIRMLGWSDPISDKSRGSRRENAFWWKTGVCYSNLGRPWVKVDAGWQAEGENSIWRTESRQHPKDVTPLGCGDEEETSRKTPLLFHAFWWLVRSFTS